LPAQIRVYVAARRHAQGAPVLVRRHRYVAQALATEIAAWRRRGSGQPA
jgi:stress-induced morphogen